MSVVTSRESVDRAVEDLEAAVGRAQPILSASVSRIAFTDLRHTVAVTVEGSRCFTFHPRFPCWLDANDFRTAALEIVSAAT